MKIRVSAPEQGALIEALGGTAVTIGTPEVAGALQQGVVDGVVTAASGGARSYADLIRYNFRLPINPTVNFISVNKSEFDALSSANQEALRKLAGETGAAITAALAGAEDSSVHDLEFEGRYGDCGHSGGYRPGHLIDAELLARLGVKAWRRGS